ncbi:hypothetical protein G5C65_32375, partial [Streptomyces sp. SB3404]|nr:hypothetical protein [Streptomyces boncukensis]
PGRQSLTARLDEWRRKRIIPQANWYPRRVYAERLKRAGFTGVEVRDVTAEVLEANAEFVRNRCAELLLDPRFRAFKHKSAIRWHLRLTELRAASRGYVIASAAKPHDGQ